MRKLIALPAALACMTLAAPAFAQGVYIEYGTGPVYGYAPAYSYAPAYGYAPAETYGYYGSYGSYGYSGTSRMQRDLDRGRYTASDVGPGAITFGRARPDPIVGNNTSRGTDTRGTVDPPARDRDVADAFKKID